MDWVLWDIKERNKPKLIYKNLENHLKNIESKNPSE
jgi:hypothetical protein